MRAILWKIFVAVLVIEAIAAAWCFGQNQCGPGGCGVGQQCGGQPPAWQPQQLEWQPANGAARQPQPQRRESPSPCVVQIISRRGDHGKNGTGTIVSLKNGEATIVSCAHILAAGYTPAIRYSDGNESPATILSTDALTDSSVLRANAPPSARYLDLDADPQPGEQVSWCGYSSRGYVSGAARVIGYEGASLVISGNVPEGTSGGPVYTSRGLVAVLTECRQAPGEPWQTLGPCALLLRRKLAVVLVPQPTQVVSRPPTPTTPVATLPLPPAPDTPPADAGPCASIGPLLERLDKIEARLAAIKIQPGPPGLPGKDGKDGTPGRDGKDAELQPINVDDLAKEVAKKLPPIRIRTLNLDGSIHQEVQARLGDLVILKPIAVKAEAK